MDPITLLQRIVTKPCAGDLVALQGHLLLWEEGSTTPENRQRIEAVLALLGEFHCFLTGLESKLEAHAYAELASKMDMGAVGGVIAENVLGAGEKLLERVLVGGISEALMVLASRQYIKAFDRELGAFYQQTAWQLRTCFWRLSAGRNRDISPAQRSAMMDALFRPLLDKKVPGAAKSILIGSLFQISLLALIAPIFES